MSKGKGYL
jgi:hypothetical protein